MTALITEPGVYEDIGTNEYFAEPCPEPALTNSGVKTLLTASPQEFAYAHPALGPGEEALTLAQVRLGDVGHQLTLGKGRGYRVCDADDWRTKAAQAFKEEALAEGFTPVTRKEFAKAQAIAQVMQLKIRQTLGYLGDANADYGTEVVIAWQEETSYGKVWCRAMLDVFCPALTAVVDPKFSKMLMDGAFEQHASKLGWDMQATWYKRGLDALFPEQAGRWRFIDTVVRPVAPYASRSREACEATEYSCTLEINRAIELFGKCLHNKDWPGYPDQIEPWTAKSWTLAERAARSIEEDA